MSMQDVEMIFKFVGGLGMFLYGMNIMADGLQKSAGPKMKRLMGILTNNRLLAVLVGTLVTAIIQSSSATTVMVVGFVNAGIMNLSQAVGVIMGANVGTTVTAWLVSMSEWGAFLKPEFFAPLLIGVGAFIMLFAKRDGKKQAGEILVGFGVLFIGLSFMSGAITPYKDAPIFSEAFRVLGSNPFLGILAGLIVTAVIQSSSASVGILQTLAINGLVTWNSAVYITLGQNMGTCVTALISCAGTNKTAKRAAVIHFLFNAIGAAIFGVLMFVIFQVDRTFAASSISSVEISIFHSIFNITNTIILFPFANKLVKLSGLLIKDKDEDDKNEESEAGLTLRNLDSRILENPAFAVENSVSEVIHMGQITYENTKRAFEACLENDEDKIAQVYAQEKDIDQMAGMISDYLVKISSLSLTEKQHELINHLFYTVSDIERIGDHAENLAELAKFKVNNNIVFSEKANKELEGIMEYVTNSIVYALRAREGTKMDAVLKAKEYEEQVDYIEGELREKHIERLSENLCAPRAGVVFLDILSNLERISDHADNIAGYVKKEL